MRALHTHPQLHVDDVADILQGSTRTRRSGHSAVIDEYKQPYTGESVGLHIVAKTKVMRLEISVAVSPNGDPPIPLGTCFDIKRFTIDDYRRKQFAAVISQWN